MARIIYKKGCEGQNRIESIEGIEIDLLNGQKALIYPKYAELPLLTDDKIAFWDAKRTSEIEALKKDENLWATGALLRCGSPAAQYVSNFRSDKHSIFGLPTLLAALEIQDQKFSIDALANVIWGADLLCDFDNNVWSCFRYSEGKEWIAYGGGYGFTGDSGLYCSLLAVPVVLYR
nr:MAG TPA: hypothetical protein [Caudoviricetes sp.]